MSSLLYIFKQFTVVSGKKKGGGKRPNSLLILLENHKLLAMVCSYFFVTFVKVRLHVTMETWLLVSPGLGWLTLQAEKWVAFYSLLCNLHYFLFKGEIKTGLYLRHLYDHRHRVRLGFLEIPSAAWYHWKIALIDISQCSCWDVPLQPFMIMWW